MLLPELQVFNGIIPLSPSIRRFCGTTLPAPVESSSNTMMVKFKTDGSVSQRGFSAQYTSYDEASECVCVCVCVCDQ